MQERVTSTDQEFFDIILQHNPDQMSVGVGLVTDENGANFIESLYAGSEMPMKIGKAFFKVRREDFEDHIEFQDRLEEANFYTVLGRDILDAIAEASQDKNGVFTWLDRPATNRLIRLLRKARDESFGRDE